MTEETKKAASKKLPVDLADAYKTLVDNSVLGLVIMQDNRLVFVNAMMTTMTGFSRKDLLSIPVSEFARFIHPDDRERVLVNFRKRSAGEKAPVHQEFRFTRKDGKIRWTQILANTIHFRGKDAIQVAYLDITRQKEAEEALSRTEERYESLFQRMMEGFALHEIICDEKGKPVDYRFVEANPAFEKLTGLKVKQIVGKTVLEVIPNLEPYWIEVYGKVALTGEPIQFENYAEQLDSYYTVSAFSPRKGQFATIFSNITALKKAEENLKWELSVNASIADLSDALLDSQFSLKQTAGTVLECAKRLTGSRQGYVTSIDPETKANVGHTLTDMMKKACGVERKREPMIFPMAADGKYGGLWGHALNTRKAFYTNSPAEHETSTGVPKGHIPLKNFLSAPAYIGENLLGQIALANNSDGYDQKQLDAIKRLAKLYALAVQRRRIEETLLSSLKEKEVLLKEIHHRVKNNLQIIISLLNFQARLTEDKKMIWGFEESKNRIHSMALVHEKLYKSKDFSRIQFSEYIQTIASELSSIYSLNRNITLTYALDEIELTIDQAIPLGLILNEVISNALVHAFKEREGGNLFIFLKHLEKAKAQIEIRDDGKGMSLPFDFNDSETMGLKLVSILTDQIEGTLAIERKKGMAFTITFPVKA